MIRMVANEFRYEYDPTIEDSYCCAMMVDGRTEHLDILDTAGQDQYSMLMHHWTRDTDSFMMVYDIRSKKTFDHAQKLYNQLSRYKEEGRFNIILIGNKCDLYDPMDKILQNMQLTRSNIKNLVYGYVREIDGIISIPIEMKEICLEFHGKSVSQNIEVTYEMGKNLANSWDAPFLETSAKTEENVFKAFETLVQLSRKARRDSFPVS